MSKLSELIATLKAADKDTARIVSATVPACQEAGTIAERLAALLQEESKPGDPDRAALTRSAAKAVSVALAMCEREAGHKPSPRSLAGHKALAGGDPRTVACQALWLLYRDAALAGVSISADLEAIGCRAGKRGPVAKPQAKPDHAGAAYACKHLLAVLAAVADVRLDDQALVELQAEAEADVGAERERRAAKRATKQAKAA